MFPKHNRLTLTGFVTRLGALLGRLGVVLGVVSACAQTSNGLIASFETTAQLNLFTKNNCTVSLSTNGVTEGLKAAQVVFANVDYPNIYFRTNTGYTNADWRSWGGLAVDILNTNDVPVPTRFRVDDDFSADGSQHCQTGSATVPAKSLVTLAMPFAAVLPPGMKGGPPLMSNALQMSVSGPALDWSHIVAFQLFLGKPGRSWTLFVDNFRLVPPANTNNLADAYGQFTGADWPGKAHSDADFASQDTEEKQWLNRHPKPADRDIYGAWAVGPTLTNHGFFRPAFIWNGRETNAAAAPTNEGRWWLVAPSGKLFFSLGVDSINYTQDTLVTGREYLFSWLPATGDPLLPFAPFKTTRWASFYGMNLYRKFGADSTNAARVRALDRLESWGFNTIGNWSVADLFSQRRVPYTLTVSYSQTGLAKFSPTTKSIVDVYDTNFPAKVAAGMSNGVAAYKNDPWCLGYFVENELPWADYGSTVADQYALPMTVLAQTNPLPAKAELARQLQAKYPTIADLNTAWSTAIASWSQISNDVVTLPGTPTAACLNDLDQFLTNFARVYFSVVSTNLKRFAPNQLYLGCRFSTHPLPAVTMAAQYCDVISFNIYSRWPDTNAWAFTRSLNKPCLIGEFHSGALDRGMFHPGLVKAADQTDRGLAYQQYVQTVLSLPAFVGCHWFEYHDEPLTGRSDGENYNIGMVSNTDTPYWELLEAVQQMNSAVYNSFALGLNIATPAGNPRLSWPSNAATMTLYAATNLSNPVWNRVAEPPAFSNGQWWVWPTPSVEKKRFFRLQNN